MKLPKVATEFEMYGLVTLDQTEDLARMFGLDLAETSSLSQIESIQMMIGENVAKYVSGLILDPRSLLDIETQKEDRPGLAFRLLQDPTQLTDPPTILPNWGVEAIKNNYGLAFLTLPYHPKEENALAKKKFVAEIFDFCVYEGINLIVDIQLISPDGGKVHPENLLDIQLQTIQELRGFADLLALDYPGSALAAASVTAELDKPWVLSSRDQNYGQFKEQLRDSLASGARGFLIGQSLWYEMGKLRKDDQSPDFDQIPEYIQTTVRDRVIELTRIIDETAKKED